MTGADPNRPRHITPGIYKKLIFEVTCSSYRELLGDNATEIPAYSDTLGTWEKCHCNQIVTVTRSSLVTNQSFGTYQMCHCHCKRGDL